MAEPVVETPPAAPAPEDEVVVDEDLIAATLSQLAVTKKKAKGKRTTLAVAQPSVSAAPLQAIEAVQYTYSQMLNRLYDLLHASKPGIGDRERARIPPPNMSRVGSTRTAWTNFKKICETISRTSEHVLSFFLVELDTTGAIDGSGNLLIRGRYLPAVIESILRQYITEYVMCPMCKSLETDLDRDPETRLYFLNCKSCGSSRCVAQIKPGHHATTRADRRKAKQAKA